MKMKFYFLWLFLIAAMIPVSAQDYVFFDDSPDNVFYDWSWGMHNAPSYVERVGDKFPVNVDTVFFGLNSLKLHWKSAATGDWMLACAGEGTPWPTWDITQKDSLTMWVYSPDGITNTALPEIYLEDNSNRKTTKAKIGDWTVNILPNAWTKVSLPLSVFQPGSAGADLTTIKTIFFGRNTASLDNTNHILYLDEIRMISASGGNDTTAPAVPTIVGAFGFEKHIDLQWVPNTEVDLNGYQIYRYNGSTFDLIGLAAKDETFFTDWVGSAGENRRYVVTALDGSMNESDFSTELSATTQNLTDDQMLDMIQLATFRYFWDYAHPTSGMSRERSGSNNTVTIGGTGFGIMTIPAAIERGFITREEGVTRMLKILSFLSNDADRFHGAYSHWLNGETGAVIPFSAQDNGGDLVETAFLIQGLLTCRSYFDGTNASETVLRLLITQIWETVEWDWYRKDNGNYLYWHWSPDYQWAMNFPLIGPNETMIVYLLAIASPTHSVPASLFHNGWASSSDYVNGNSYYGYPLYVGWPFGGPLFFAHYSFLGFDPRDKKDAYCNYFNNNKNHTLINRAYCIDNPHNFLGYDENTWGLTASDDPLVGYQVHEPTRDNGTITPTAALSSMPYTPTESIEAAKDFYRSYGENLWGPYGFYDAFNLQEDWYATTYLAIDQGPIMVMIENYRSGLLWDKFMANPEIQPMLDAIGFQYDPSAIDDNETSVPAEFALFGNYPNPFNPSTVIRFSLPSESKVTLAIYNVLGQKVKEYVYDSMKSGLNEITWNGNNESNLSVNSGVYFYTLSAGERSLTGKMILQK